ncbi:hypothetical protein J2129_001382 [Methanofollis sp. W23]|nr:hypothetical protein [Methanofollis sp. W23]
MFNPCLKDSFREKNRSTHACNPNRYADLQKQPEKKKREKITFPQKKEI